jgi:hypothetical protein
LDFIWNPEISLRGLSRKWHPGNEIHYEAAEESCLKMMVAWCHGCLRTQSRAEWLDMKSDNEGKIKCDSKVLLWKVEWLECFLKIGKLGRKQMWWEVWTMSFPWSLNFEVLIKHTNGGIKLTFGYLRCSAEKVR